MGSCRDLPEIPQNTTPHPERGRVQSTYKYKAARKRDREHDKQDPLISAGESSNLAVISNGPAEGVNHAQFVS